MSFQDIRHRIAETIDHGIGHQYSIPKGVRNLGDWQERDRALIPTDHFSAESEDAHEN